jgi:uncharacterized membrane protein YkvA (DUF1232 family)
MMRTLRNLSHREIVIILLSLVYIVSPIDLIPELVAGPLGLTDDAPAAVLIGMTLWRAHGRSNPGDSEVSD